MNERPGLARPRWTSAVRALLAACTLALLTGCATVPGGATAPHDPWERWNRSVYAFNDQVDQAVLKPVAQAYRDVVPQLVRTGVGNVLGNIGDVWSAANHLMQGKLQDGLEMGMRVLTNTFFGLGGLLDPATEFGLTRRSEDFGQTLGRWGVGSGPFLMLPFLGPSTLRDSAGLLVDRQTGASTLPPTSGGQVGVGVLEVVHLRAGLLSTLQLLDDVALDRYSFVRDAYLARRRDAVYDGAAPLESFDFDDEPPPAPAATPAPQAARPAAAATTTARHAATPAHPSAPASGVAR